MKTLQQNNMEICSLSELREHLDLQALTAAFLDGTLEKWLSACYYEREAAAVQALEHIASPGVKRKLCAILGVAPLPVMPEEQAAWERKREALLRCSAGEDMLAHIPETATNQAELAELLDGGFETVYLCEGCFSVPIRKSGIHYVGVGNPQMETPFTEEQYRRAGITFENITLPEQPDSTVRSLAEEAAAANGYDNFAETHCRLAVLLHNRIKGFRAIGLCHLDWDADPAGEFYSSKWAAESAARRVIDNAYEKADAYFIPERVTCLAAGLAENYADMLQGGMDIAECLRGLERGKQMLADSLREKIGGAQQELRRRFDRELTDNADYYRMYKKSYFLEQINIEQEDFVEGLFDSDVLTSLARLLPGACEYGVENLIETLMELEEDVDKHAEVFSCSAWKIYQSYRREIENIAEEIGKDLSDDELIRLGILKAV